MAWDVPLIIYFVPNRAKETSIFDIMVLLFSTCDYYNNVLICESGTHVHIYLLYILRNLQRKHLQSSSSFG